MEVIENIVIPLFVIDPQHVVTHWNRACEKLTGLAAGEMIGSRRHWRAFYAENRPVLADFVLDGKRAGDLSDYYGNRVKASELLPGALEAECFFPALGENGRWLYITAAPLHDHEGGIIGAVETLQDITDRREADIALRRTRAELENRIHDRTAELATANRTLKKEVAERRAAEKAIARSEEKFRTVAEFTYDWEYWLDPGGRHIYVSPSCRRVTGYTAEDFQSNENLLLEIIHPDDRRQVHRHLRKELSESHIHHLDFRIINRAGNVCWISHYCQPVYDRHGNYLGRRGSNRDVTERREAEEAMRAFAAELKQSNEDLQNFASMASHDLQEPLILIEACADRLAKKYGGSLPEQGSEYLKRLNGSVRRMRTLIDSMLKYARLTTRTQEFEPLDLSDILENVLDELSDRLHQRDAEIELGDLPRIQADPVQIHQLFQNLISNALKYSRADTPLRLRIYSETAGTDENGRPVRRVIVRDNGIGFDEKDAERLFGFCQRLGVDAQGSPGAGIGLAICRRIVERHGGWIRAEGQPDSGASFIITLPVDE